MKAGAKNEGEAHLLRPIIIRIAEMVWRCITYRKGRMIFNRIFFCYQSQLLRGRAIYYGRL